MSVAEKSAKLAETPPTDSYGTILKSSSITGGSTMLTYTIGLVRTKLIAVLLGTSGIGLIGIYNAIVNLSFTATTSALLKGGVREIAAARGDEDSQRLAEIQLAVCRLANLLGLGGAVILALLSPWISAWLFDGPEFAVWISLLGAVLYFKGINVAQKALLQGHRQIGNLAKVSVFSALVSTVLAILLYYAFGQAGIVPALILTSIITMSFGWWYARRLSRTPEQTGWRTSASHWKRLIAIGSAVAWGGVLVQSVPFYAKSLIVSDLGLDANGLYMAAWAISGLFANFVLQAMGADYFPRLSAASKDPVAVERLINEQTEIGILLALPGILATFAFAPFVISLLYTAEFAAASILLQWFLLGVFGRVILWPLGMIMLAKGESRTFAICQTITVAVHLLLITLAFQTFGLVGTAMAFGVNHCIVAVIYTFGAFWLYRFRWSAQVKKLVLNASLVLLLVSLLPFFVESAVWSNSIKVALCLIVGFACLRGIFARVSEDPVAFRIIQKCPGWVIALMK